MSAAALTIEQEVWRPRFNPWLIAVVVALAAFMEVLDTSIANVALPYMAGNLGASNDQSTWVLTSYLVSNAIILPISGWLAGALGRKRFFMACLGIFTVSSLLCGIAPNLGLLLVFRVLQGGAVAACSQWPRLFWRIAFHRSSEAWRLPCMASRPSWRLPSDQPWAGGSPSTTPGGGFSSSISRSAWSPGFWCGALLKTSYLKRVKAAGVKLDYIGIALLTLGIGALQMSLDRGQEDDWFGSRFITTLVVVATVCLISLVIWEWFQKAPLIDVRMFKNFNFASASLMLFTLGILLFSALVLMPQFLQTSRIHL